MLDFALKYRSAIDTITATRDYNLRKYELLPAEWKIAAELREVLKVNTHFFIPSITDFLLDRFSRMRLCIFLEEHRTLRR